LSVFTTRAALDTAVDDYLASRVGVTFGSQVSGPIANWDVSAIKDFSWLFSFDYGFQSHGFNPDLSKWDVSNAWTMAYMFVRVAFFNSALTSCNVLGVKTMAYMFYSDNSYNLDH
jgi:hypothetical protein